MATFGYLNENNPSSIGENEAQAMVNCRIDRGFIEFDSYEVNEEIPVPNRRVPLPNGRTVKIETGNTDDFVGDGMVAWKKQSESDWYSPSCAITPEMVANGFTNWSIDTAAAPAAREVYVPQMAGQYFYCATITDNRTNVESSPFFFPYIAVTEADVEARNGIRFTMRHVRDLDDNYTIKVYRLPFGSEQGEWMLIFDRSGFIADDPAGEQRFDPMPDEYLVNSEMCETVDLTNKVFESKKCRSVSLFDNKLWVGEWDTDTGQGKKFGLLYYSRTGRYAEFPAKNFFSFPDPVVGVTPYDQQLVVQTEKELYYIYGDPDNYSMKLIDYKFNGIVANSGQALGAYAYFLACDNLTQQNRPRGVFLFNGSVVAEISQNINREFPAVTTFHNWVLDNRFFIFELKNEENDIIRIVYDSVAKGFCTVDKTLNCFRYRTKEFTVLPNNARHLKKICIRAKGAWILYVIADGRKILTKHRQSSRDVKDFYLYVKPNRATSYSFVFEGVGGTEIHDWSIAE